MEIYGNLLTKDGFKYGRVIEKNGVFEDVSPDYELRSDPKTNFILPGFVDIHAAGLNQHISARAAAEIPLDAAFLAHDASLATSGITTALTTLILDRIPQRPQGLEVAREVVRILRRARSANILRVRHLIHLRCELTDDGALADAEEAIGDFGQDIGLITAMEHVPGRRQFREQHHWDATYKKMFPDDAGAFLDFTKMRSEFPDSEFRSRRKQLAKIAKDNNISFATHDDETQSDAYEAVELGACLAEFPITDDIAGSLQRAGIPVVLGAPNVLRGGSHVGNVSARKLIEIGAASIISSDYAPATILPAIAAMSERGVLRPDLLNMAALAPARAVGMQRFGSLDEGSYADFLVVSHSHDFTSIRETWLEGRRVS